MTPDRRETDYRIRISNVFQYIDQHLDASLSLKQVAEIAHFSPFHFHRIFKQLTGETLNEFVSRRRIEKSVPDLLHTQAQISALAHTYGFSDNSAYTKAFKKYYGTSPTKFRQQNPHKFSRIRPLKSKNGQAYPELDHYVRVIDNLKNWIMMNANIQLREMNTLNYAYISCLGSQALPAAFQKLMGWAASKEILTKNVRLMTMYHDSLKVTEEAKARLSACVMLDTPVAGEGEIGISQLPHGKYIVGSFTIALEDFEKSWTSLYLWMNENGYEKADRDPFEIYHNNYNEHPEKKAIVDFYIPIE